MTTATMKLSALGQAALEYAEQGWPVFPLAPKGKIPITKNGFKDASTDPVQVTEWWLSYPDANIGFSTGRGQVVLDVDGETGQDTLGMLVATYEKLPKTKEVQTGAGRHLYFKYNGQLGNSAGKLGEKLDTRGDGGYVILPPSIHPNGGEYTWTNDGEIAELPNWIAALLEKKRDDFEFVLRDTSARKSERNYGDLHPYVAAFFHNKCNALAKSPEGVRNHRLNNLAFECGRIAQAGYANGSYMERCVKDAATAAGLDGREIEKTWESGYNDGWLASPFVILDKEDDVFELEKPKKAPSKSALVITPLSKVKREHVDFLWGYRLVQGGVNLLIGDGGLGKSAIALHIAHSVTDGVPLPDDKGQQVRGKVMLVTYEDPPDLVKSRAKVIGIDLDQFFVIEGERDEDFGIMPFTKDSVDHLMVALEDYPDTRMLILDPWGRYLDDDDHKEKLIRRAIAPLERLAQRYNVTVLIIGHTNKSTEYASAEHRISGHSAFKNVARSVLMIGRVSDTSNAVAHVKHNWSSEQPACVYTWDDDKQWADGENPLSWGEVLKLNPDELFAAKKVSKIEQAVRWLRSILVDGPVEFEDLKEQAEEEGYTNQLTKASVRLGIVKERSGNQWSGGIINTWRLPNDSESNPTPSELPADEYNPEVF